MRILIALGGNALSPRGERLTVASQRAAAARAAVPLAALAADHEVVVTHGSGPQVGLLSLQAAALDPDNDFTLDVLDAASAGLIGYLLEQAITNRLPEGREAVTLLTRTVVAADDPGFEHPTKFVGPVYDDTPEIREMLEAKGWSGALDGTHLRRVVASPQPVEVLPVTPLGPLLDLGYLVICGGGGGMAVVTGEDGLTGVDAVVDKDAVSALLAERLDVDLFVIATDVAQVSLDWGTPQERPLDVLDVAEHPVEVFPDGSMGPKVEAAARFARTGRRAMIGRLDDVSALVADTAGTRVIDSAIRP